MKPYVLRYWEQEFTQLKPMKRRGNRRYYQHHEVLLIRRIRDLLYEQGFTISGARNRLSESGPSRAATSASEESSQGELAPVAATTARAAALGNSRSADASVAADTSEVSMHQMRQELILIRGLLGA